MADLTSPLTGQENPNQGGLLGLYLKTGSTAAFGGTLVLPNVASSVQATNKQSPIKMEILGLTLDTIAITAGNDATNFSAELIPISATTGNYVASSSLTNGQYLFPSTWAFTHYKFTKSSASNTCALAISYNTAPKT